MTRLAAAALGSVVLVGATACGATRARPVPDVTGERLDVAEDTLDTLGLRYRALGGGTFGIVVRSRWYVCRQTPRAHAVAKTVALTVARKCSVPDVVGEPLDDAEDELDEAGIHAVAHSVDGGPVILESLWTVCEQEPEAGATLQPIELYVAHDCECYDE